MLKAEIRFTSGRETTFQNIEKTQTTTSESIAFIHDDGAITVVPLHNVEFILIWDDEENEVKNDGKH